ncbi:TlpA family protein disulfide reductase [Pseudarthrobacter phenanthrenivorans]|uniref:TlpA family protein disulfide reductase n=1 Tax=Pseudarthrobacter phenanthrenivorans TaxID=361575 RepID=A0A3B0FPF1_PSEPS|nr:TlpA disulfide reductase family protein [Pseudarthrobacter phenanthrenivorans]RKO21779.1 TlpA family protein disulfide reductase [Pseudarthrobacter phenanthrenivorans]
MTTTKNPRRIFTITAVIAAAALILILSLTALNRGSETTSAAGPVGANNVDRIELTAVDGKALTVPSTRPTVLYFMASWCYTCVPQAKAMKELEQQYADKADFVAVDVTPENTKTQVDQFRELADTPGYPFVVDQTGDLTQKYAVTSLDSTVVVAPDGDILGRADSRPMKADALKAFLDTTLP